MLSIEELKRNSKRDERKLREGGLRREYLS